MEHKCAYGSYFTELEKPEFLGYHYLLLTPSDLGSVFWQSIPLVLIQGLLNGETEPSGTMIVEASGDWTTYRVKNFEGDITIPDSFQAYLKELGGIDGLLIVGILDEKVANIIDKALAGQKTSILSGSEATNYQDKDLISSLTELGVPLKKAETLLPLTPKNLTLPEATKFALEKHMKS